MSGVFGGKSREVLEWAAGMDTKITPAEIDASYGSADILDQWDEVHKFNEQLYTVLRATTEGNPFDLVENCSTGAGLDAWRSLHRRLDPATGSRKRVMLHALTNPERAGYETLLWNGGKLSDYDMIGRRTSLEHGRLCPSLWR